MYSARRAASSFMRVRKATPLPHRRAPTTVTPAPRSPHPSPRSSRPPSTTTPTTTVRRQSTSACATAPLTAGQAAVARAPAASSTGARTLTIGLASGTLGAMCGLGGAIFAIPALMRYHALAQPVAAGTALVAVSAVSVCGTTVFALRDAVHPELAAPLALAAATSTPVGAALAARVAPAALRRGLAVFMLSLSPALFLRDALAKRAGAADAGAEAVLTTDRDAVTEVVDATGERRRRGATLAAAGAAIGVLSGVLGISGGSLFTPVIALAEPQLPFRDVVGTSFATMVVPTIVAAVSYARAGHIARPLAPMLVVGAAAGAAAGSAAALALPDEVLRNGFACIVALLGLRMLRAPVSLPVAKR